MEKYIRDLISDLQDYGCDISDGKQKVSNKTLASHLICHGVMVQPAVPGKKRDDWDIDERIFRNGESRMKEQVVEKLVEMRSSAGGEYEMMFNSIIKEVRLL
jgi:hypothetical protein